MKKVKRLRGFWKNASVEVKKHQLIYFALTLVLLGAAFVRLYRLGSLLNFYYDQGRDALVIWRLWHEGKLFLIGPITGLKGIFLGPFYYYLIAPFYLVGHGNPLYPALFLSLLSIAAVFIVYVLSKEMHSRAVGLIAATISAFSFDIFRASRWLANPTPILLSSVLFLYSLWKILTGGSQKWWVFAALLVGLSLQFEAASAVFYILIFIIFWLWLRNRKKGLPVKLPDLKTYFYSFAAFFVTVIPQIIFNFRHENLLIKNFYDFFFQEKAFRVSINDVFMERSHYFWNVFSTKLFPGNPNYAVLFIFLSMVFLLVGRKKLKKGLLKLFLIFLGVPIVGYYLFQGNYGNIYDYYLTGYYLPFIILFSIGLSEVASRKMGFVLIILFFVAFLSTNIRLIGNYLIYGPGENVITLEDELKAVNWVFDDTEGRGKFNIDVYVPPVIPYAYDYLFLWQGSERCGRDLCGIVEESEKKLYVLYEKDLEHPNRLENWLGKYEGNTMTEKQVSYGNIIVQRRLRTD
jgi:4-amino-4-deoxy-L-arabinose transferase-like glycosyltransferase